jgi:dTDP-4-dehydrorhamnose reductase
MRILITGSKGQLGYELLRTRPEGYEIIAVDIEELDITDWAHVSAFLGEKQPDLIINSAAYTAVDRAEKEPDLAYSVNADGAGNLARGAGRYGARMVQISTDFVFNGKQGAPWKPSDVPDPLSVYGSSKLAGEERVRESLEENLLILRTSWLYSAHGSNFVKTMLHLLRDRDWLNIVGDQVGSPTWAKTLAEAIWFIAGKKELSGIHHWSDAGVASWYDFAVAIQEEGLQAGLLEREIPIRPISSVDYPTLAHRPAYSVLDKSSFWSLVDLEPLHWRIALRLMLKELAGSASG